MSDELSTGRVARRTVAALVVLAGIALVIGLAFPGFVSRTVVPTFLYFPGRTDAARSAPADHGLPSGEELRLRTEDGVELHAWWVPAEGEACGAVLYFHGNAGALTQRAPVAARIAAGGRHALMVDYRGYGLSGGSPSEAGLRRDALASWRHLTGARGLEADRIAVAGHSLGAAVAAELAARVDPGPGAAVLTGAFTSVPALAERLYRWLPDALFRGWPTENWDVIGPVGRIEAPVFVARGGRDDLVPRSLTRRVHAAAGDGAVWYEAPAAGHGDLWFDETFWGRLDPFLDRALGCG